MGQMHQEKSSIYSLDTINIGGLLQKQQPNPTLSFGHRLAYLTYCSFYKSLGNHCIYYDSYHFNYLSCIPKHKCFDFIYFWFVCNGPFGWSITQKHYAIFPSPSRNYFFFTLFYTYTVLHSSVKPYTCNCFTLTLFYTAA